MQQITERWQGHLGGTEIHIGGSDLLGFGRGTVQMNSVSPDGKVLVGPSWQIRFWTYLDRESGRGFGAYITKH